MLAEGESHSIEESHAAVTNIGVRPTVSDQGQTDPTIEVHLLDFEGDLYGRSIELEFVSPLRREQRFPDLDALRAQIELDVGMAREVLE